MTAGNLVRQAADGGGPGLHAAPDRTSEFRLGILCHGKGSGSARAALDLAYALHRRGLAVLLITLGFPRWKLPPDLPRTIITEPELPEGVEARWPMTAIERLAQCLRQICHMRRLDLLHYHYAFPFAGAAARLTEAGASPPRIVATLHGGDIMRAQEDPELRQVLASALSHAGAITSVSHAYADMLQALAGRECLTVPNFLPSERRAVPRPNHVIGREVTLVHVSNFRAVKNVQQIGQVFLALRRFRDCRLLMVGDGPHRHALQTMLRGCASSVRFFGMLDDAKPVISTADVMILASRSESFSLAALEAMSAGVPVVAPCIAGLSETVREGAGGALFASGRPQDAVRRLLRLSQSPHLYRRLARAAYRTADKYSEVMTVDAYLDLYRRVLAA